MGENDGGVTFRVARAEDVVAIMRSRSTDAEWGPADHRTRSYLEGRHHPQSALPARTAFLAMKDDKVLGYIAGHLTQRYDCDGELQYLWVAPSDRGRDIATRLLELLALWFSEQPARRICVDVLPDNSRARSFYMRHGARELNPNWMCWDDITTCVPRT